MNWSLRKQKVPLTAREQLELLKRSRKFLGVQIANCGCSAGSSFAGQFFSFSKAPSLPLPGCKAVSCTCQYRGVTDRRRDMERRKTEWTPRKDERRKTARRKGADVWKWLDQ